MNLQVVPQIVIPLLTIGFSGILAAYIAHRLATNRADREFRLKRLEEMFISLTRFSIHHTGSVVPYLLVMRGQSTLAAAQEKINSQTSAEGGRDLDNVEMLVRIYFPDLRPAFDGFVRIRDKIGNDYIAEMLTRIRGGRDCRDLAPGFLRAVGEFHNAGERLKENMLELAGDIRSRSLRKRIHAFVIDQFG